MSEGWNDIEGWGGSTPRREGWDDIEAEGDLDAFLAAIDAALTAQFGPNHQEILGTTGQLYSAFEW